METNKKRLAQDIDIDNNPVNKDIIPENKNIKKTTPTPTSVIIDKDNKIEEIPQPTPRPAVKNTVRYIDSGFPF